MRRSKSASLMLGLLIFPSLVILSGADDEPRMDLEKTASAERLAAAIHRHTETLSGYLASEEKYKDKLTHDQIVSRASSIALLAYGLQTLDAKPDKLNVPLTIAAARKIAASESYADAAAALKELQSQPQSVAPVEVPDSWDNVADFQAVMEEVKELLGELKRTHRRSRDPEQDSLDAMTVAVIAYAVKADESYALDEADEQKWKQLATKMHDDFSALDAAMRAKDTDKTREIYDKITESCAGCHKDFRE